METNINSFYKLLDIAKKYNTTMVYASSAATYGNLKSPQTEVNVMPENPYGFSKLMMDQIAHEFSKNNPEMVLVGLRYFNVYGPGEYYKRATSSMVIQLGHQILNGAPPRLFEGSENIYRDFIYIDDAIQANIKACFPKKNGVYNVGTSNPRSFQDISDILQKELGTNFKTEYFKNPYDGYQTHTQADISSSKSNLDFDPKFSLEQGISLYIEDIRRLHGTDNI
jgi:ADP-L-glycero-D-manno-heptose 6-epimerase